MNIDLDHVDLTGYTLIVLRHALHGRIVVCEGMYYYGELFELEDAGLITVDQKGVWYHLSVREPLRELVESLIEYHSL